MRNIQVERVISAPRAAVWGVLADFPNIADWNTGVKKSFSTGTQETGLGATRHCDLAPLGGLEETAKGWTPNEQLIVSIDSTKKLPIKHGMVTFDLTDSGDGTQVALNYEYQSKFGFLDRVLGGALDKKLEAGFVGFLEDLDKASVAA